LDLLLIVRVLKLAGEMCPIDSNRRWSLNQCTHSVLRVPLETSRLESRLGESDNREKLWKAMYELRSRIAHGSGQHTGTNAREEASKEVTDGLLAQLVVRVT